MHPPKPQEWSGNKSLGFNPISAFGLNDLGTISQDLGSTACSKAEQAPLLAHSFVRLTESHGNRGSAKHSLLGLIPVWIYPAHW